MAVSRLELRLNLKSKGFDERICLDLPLNGVTALYGPSGSGKTSILRAVAGLDKHKCTRINYAEEIWQDEQIFVPTHARGLAYVFQQPVLFSHLTVEQNIQFAVKRSNFSAAENQLSKDTICQRLNISHLLDRLPFTLSGGESQRVAIARALCSYPRLLLMDEPLSALDTGNKAEIIPLLEQVCADVGVPVLYVSHALNEVARLSDNLVLLEQGRVLESGLTRELLVELKLPFSQQSDAISVIDAWVVEHEAEFGVTLVRTKLGDLNLLQADHLQVGESIRIQVAARDVSITRDDSNATSILNRLRLEIVDIGESDQAQATVKLEANKVALLSKITKKSLAALELSIGEIVIVQIKSCALL